MSSTISQTTKRKPNVRELTVSGEGDSEAVQRILSFEVNVGAGDQLQVLLSLQGGGHALRGDGQELQARQHSYHATTSSVC